MARGARAVGTTAATTAAIAAGRGADRAAGCSPNGDEADAELERHVRRSLRWALGGQIVRRSGTWLSTVVLARLFLDREDFGVAAVGLTASLVLLAVNDLGVAAAVTRDRSFDRVLLGTARTVSAVTSASLYAALFAAAPLIVRLAGVEGARFGDAVGVMRLYGLTLLVDGLVAPFAGALGRVLAERRRALAENAGIAVSLATALAVAAAGGGPWALAASQVAASATTGVLLWRCSPVRAPFGWDPRAAVGLARFGLPLVGAGLAGQLVLNTDVVVVNRALGAGAAGLFFLAFNVAGWPVSLLSLALRRTAVAGFAQVAQRPDVLAAWFRSALGLLLRVTLPIVLGLVVVAPDLIEIVYGAAWREAVTPLRFLAGLSLFRLLFGLCADLLTAVGRTAVLPLLHLLWWAALLAAMPVAARRFGLNGVAAVELAVAAVVAAPLYAAALLRAGISLRGTLRPVLAMVVTGTCLLVGAALARQLVGTPFARLAAATTGGGLAYLAAWAATRAAGVWAVPPLATILRQSRK